MNDLKRLTDEDAIGEHDRHPGEVCADIKPDREIGMLSGILSTF
ncbi:MAG: hypothetical protein ACLR0U_26665 [Enterocloster clostridioformis]